MENKTTTNKDIVAIATTDAKTLTAEVKADGLVETLQSEGLFKVFAPTDAAFGAIQTEVDKLLKPESKSKLSEVLKYHVVSGKTMVSNLKDGQELTTVEGSKLKVTVKVGNVTVGGERVTDSDISASIGAIHIIDKVLLPTN